MEESHPSLVPETICPDGRTEILFHLGDPMVRHTGGSVSRQSRSLLVAQMEGPITIVPTGRVAMIGARFVTGGLHRLLPIPQDRLVGQILDLESVWRQWAGRAAEQLADAGTPGSQLDCLERLLEDLVPRTALPDGYRSVDGAITKLRSSGGQASIERLAQEAGISRRQFERRFREHVGLSPRLFGRIVRFQRAFHALAIENGVSIAARCGYADQSHLVHEIRRFAGQTPTLLAEAEGLTAFFRG
jgi:AraC-like DNA-binding protein